jgi:transposase
VNGLFVWSFNQEREYSSQWACIESIAGKVECSSQTLKTLVSKAETELGRRHGVTQS